MFSEAVPEGSRMVILSSDGQIVSGNVKDSLGSEETKLLSTGPFDEGERRHIPDRKGEP